MQEQRFWDSTLQLKSSQPHSGEHPAVEGKCNPKFSGRTPYRHVECTTATKVGLPSSFPSRLFLPKNITDKFQLGEHI
jgi:hypothetical protein